MNRYMAEDSEEVIANSDSDDVVEFSDSESEEE